MITFELAGYVLILHNVVIKLRVDLMWFWCNCIMIISILTSVLNMAVFYGDCQWMLVHLWKWICWKASMQRTCCFQLVFISFVFSFGSILLVNWPVVRWLLFISIRWHSTLFSMHLLSLPLLLANVQGAICAKLNQLVTRLSFKRVTWLLLLVYCVLKAWKRLVH